MNQLDTLPSITFAHYASIATSLAVYPDQGNNLSYTVLGLNEEAGEVAGKLKKAIRDSKDLDKLAMLAELGDVLWYVNACANEIGFTIEHVANFNLSKLQDRAARGTLHGEGDNR